MSQTNMKYVENTGNIENRITLRGLASFIIPSFIGILLFLIPIEYNGKMTVILGILSEELKNALGSSIDPVTKSV